MARPVLDRLTRASPICVERSQAINDLLGLPAIGPYDTGTPLALGDDTGLPGGIVGLPSVFPTQPGTGGGSNPGFPGGGFPGFPGFPGIPGGGFPIIVAPPGTPGGPVTPGEPSTPTGPETPVTPPIITPPVITPSVPEPSSWVMLIVGFGMIGGAMRRRHPRLAR